MRRQAEAEVASAKRQQAFFQQHLQELTIFKARTSAALLQAGSPSRPAPLRRVTPQQTLSPEP